MNQTDLIRHRRNRLRELFAEFFRALVADPAVSESEQTTKQEAEQ